MPVSRKRKKKSGKAVRYRGPDRGSRGGTGTDLSQADRGDLAEAWRALAAHRDHIGSQRTSRAVAAARDLIADLVTVAADQPDMIIEDALCQRLGTLLGEAERAPEEDRFGPHHLSQAVVSAAADAVQVTFGQAVAWHSPWRVLTAVAGVLPYPDSEAAVDAIARLRNTPAGRALPATPPGPVVAGPVLWTQDSYGSRFAVTAPISAQGHPERWYLWDIDACGHEAFTVHSGFYATAEAALAAWQTGVGQIAAANTRLAPVDDPRLVAELMPVERGLMRPGGEDSEQFAEYYRSKRLGEAVQQAMSVPDTSPGHGLDAATAADEFATWLRAGNADQQQLPENLGELATELAESWCINQIDAVYGACSPHRVALCVLHLRDFYLDEFAEQLVALLPEWIRWLAARNGTPPDLAERCAPYAEGEPHPQLEVDDFGPRYLARVIE